MPPPAREFRTLRAGQFLQVSVPENWNALSSNNTLRFVPPNAYGEVGGQAVYTHGVEMGVVRTDTRDLRQATTAFLDRLYEANPQLRFDGQQQFVQLASRTAIQTPLANRTASGATEVVALHTTLLSNGQLFYYVTTVPQARRRVIERSSIASAVPFG